MVKRRITLVIGALFLVVTVGDMMNVPATFQTLTGGPTYMAFGEAAVPSISKVFAINMR